MNTNKNLSILFWNANSLPPHISELRDFIADDKPDLILIQEVRSKNERALKLQNYNLYLTPRTDSPTSPSVYGGTAIYVKRNIPHSHIPSIPYYNIEHTIVKIFVNNNPIFVVSAYCKIGNSSNLHTDLQNLFGLNDKIVIAGDFNAHHPAWNSRCSNQFGTIIQNHCLQTGIDIIAPDLPTRVNPNGSGSFIDFVLCKNIPFSHSINCIPALSSDHYPVKIIFQIASAFPAINHPHITDWKKFTTMLLHSPPTLFRNE